jgi:hydroxyacyl-ACP dehydratase HTD2-like protein with hotdog domain
VHCMCCIALPMLRYVEIRYSVQQSSKALSQKTREVRTAVMRVNAIPKEAEVALLAPGFHWIYFQEITPIREVRVAG